MKKNRYVVLVILFVSLLIILLAVSSQNAKVPEKAFDVGSIEVTRYVYERELSKREGSKRQAMTVDTKALWLAEWADKLRVANLAIDEGYGEDVRVLSTLRIMSRYMLVEGKGSPFFRKVIDPKVRESLGEASSPDSREWKKKHKELMGRMKSQAIEQAKVKLYPEAQKLVLEAYQKDPQNLVAQNPDEPLLAYAVKGKRITVDVKEFLIAYKEKVIKRPLKSIEAVNGEIHSYVADQILYRKAKELQLDQDWHYLQEFANFKNNVVYNIYLLQLQADQPKPSTVDLKRVYEEKNDQFVVTNKVNFWEIIAPTRESVQGVHRSVFDLVKQNANEDDWFKDLDHTKVQIEKGQMLRGETRYGKRIDRTLFQANPQWISPIVKREHGFSFVVKLADADRTAPALSEIKDSLEEIIRAEGAHKSLEAWLPALRERFPLRSYLEARQTTAL